jgi:glutamyl/glutaminyl-tRNA synthetase
VPSPFLFPLKLLHIGVLLPSSSQYRGRLAPSPTGYLHLGHARTFWTAQQRARAAGGKLILRNEDLDRSRVRPEFVRAFLEDLHWFGFTWDEGPDLGGPFAPYDQSARIELYRAHFHRLREIRAIFPCTCSRQDVRRALQAPHHGEEEPLYPGTCRERRLEDIPPGAKISWRLRVPDGEKISFHDLNLGPQQFIAGRASADFGDFIVWRHDDLPSYQLACTVDDHLMQMTEVVRGEDLLISTARQILLYRALDWTPPAFFHCPLMRDEHGMRLAKRHDSLSLRALRAAGATPDHLRAQWQTAM